MKELDIQLDKLAYDLVYCKCGGGHKTLSVADVRSAIDQALAIQRGEDQLRLDYMIAEECQMWEVNGRYSVHAVTEHHPITKEFSTAREAIDAAIRALKG